MLWINEMSPTVRCVQITNNNRQYMSANDSSVTAFKDTYSRQTGRRGEEISNLVAFCGAHCMFKIDS